MNKRQSQNIHAKRRGKERYGIVVNREKRKEIIEKIQTNQAQFVRKISNTRTIFIIDGEYKVVYDKSRKNIATFLSMDME